MRRWLSFRLARIMEPRRWLSSSAHCARCPAYNAHVISANAPSSLDLFAFTNRRSLPAHRKWNGVKSKRANKTTTKLGGAISIMATYVQCARGIVLAPRRVLLTSHKWRVRLCLHPLWRHTSPTTTLLMAWHQPLYLLYHMKANQTIQQQITVELVNTLS